MFETFVINQLLDINDYQDLGLRFYYWKDRNNHEVDLIIARNSVELLLAVEIKSRPNPVLSDCQGLKYFEEDYPKVKKICICRTPHEYREDNLMFVPWEKAVVDLKKLL